MNNINKFTFDFFDFMFGAQKKVATSVEEGTIFKVLKNSKSFDPDLSKIEIDQMDDALEKEVDNQIDKELLEQKESHE